MIKELERHINHYSPHQILRREAIKEGLQINLCFASLPVITTSCSEMNQQHNARKCLHYRHLQNWTSIEQNHLSPIWLPTFRLPSPTITNDYQFGMEAVLTVWRIRRLMILLSPISWFWAILQFRLGIYEQPNLKLNTIDFLATPPGSPVIGTHNLASPIRKKILWQRNPSLTCYHKF